MLLLDTHTLLWMLFDSSMLSDIAKRKILGGNGIFVSIASLWEIAIKQSIGKLEISNSIYEITRTCEEEDVGILSIQPGDLERLKALPFKHRDPFDCLIIAQVQERQMDIISRDSKFPLYGIRVIWQCPWMDLRRLARRRGSA